MSSFQSLDFPNMMGNLASELSRVERVAKLQEIEKTKNYLWIALELCEQIKNKFPNSEIFRLYEYLAGMWIQTPPINQIQAVQKYTLNFYLDSLK